MCFTTATLVCLTNFNFTYWSMFRLSHDNSDCRFVSWTRKRTNGRWSIRCAPLTTASYRPFSSSCRSSQWQSLTCSSSGSCGQAKDQARRSDLSWRLTTTSRKGWINNRNIFVTTSLSFICYIYFEFECSVAPVSNSMPRYATMSKCVCADCVNFTHRPNVDLTQSVNETA